MKAALARLPSAAGGGRHQAIWLGAAVAIFVSQQLASDQLGLDGWEALLRRSIFFVTTPLLIMLALLFRHFVGAWLIAAGIALNFIPMAAHGGLMPISIETIQASGYFPEITEANIGSQLHNSKDIVLRASDVRFPWLADRHALTVPGYGPNIYSLGDFVLFAGVAVAAVEAIVFAVWPNWQGINLRRRPAPRDRAIE